MHVVKQRLSAEILNGTKLIERPTRQEAGKHLAAGVTARRLQQHDHNFK